MREYHFLVSSLPELLFDKSINHKDIECYLSEFKSFLHPEDYNLISYLLLEIDNSNILNLLLNNGKKFVGNGNFNEEELKQHVTKPDYLPDYLRDFIRAFDKQNFKKSYFDYEKDLNEQYYCYAIACSNPFLSSWFMFEQNLKNIQSLVLAAKAERKAKDEMIGEDNDINEMIYHHTKNFDLTPWLPNDKYILQILNYTDILEKEWQLDKFKWDYLNEISRFKYFTVELILSFLIKLKILKRWGSINKKKGAAIFENIVKQMQNPVSI